MIDKGFMENLWQQAGTTLRRQLSHDAMMPASFRDPWHDDFCGFDNSCFEPLRKKTDDETA